jgi:putative ABC transport system permease protein
VAAPIAYFVMSRWLQDFTFHTEMSIVVLVGAGLAAVLVAWVTVSYQSFRAAAANPVQSLRSE